MHKGPRHQLPVPSQYMGGGPWVKVFRGCGLVVGRKRGSILGFPLKLIWEEMSCWDGISPKRSKYGLGPLDACHKGRQWRGLILIQIRVVKKTERGKKQDKQFCLGMENGATNTFKAMVVVEQLTSQWAVSKGHQ